VAQPGARAQAALAAQGSEQEEAAVADPLRARTVLDASSVCMRVWVCMLKGVCACNCACACLRVCVRANVRVHERPHMVP